MNIMPTSILAAQVLLTTVFSAAFLYSPAVQVSGLSGSVLRTAPTASRLNASYLATVAILAGKPMAVVRLHVWKPSAAGRLDLEAKIASNQLVLAVCLHNSRIVYHRVCSVIVRFRNRAPGRHPGRDDGCFDESPCLLCSLTYSAVGFIQHFP